MGLTKVSYAMINGAPVNVLDYGAKGDGVTDDTAAIQAAINASQGQTPARTLFLPDGNYKISSALTITNTLVIKGESQTTTNIRTTSATADVFYFNIGSTVVTGCGIQDLYISSTVAKTDGTYIKFNATSGGSFYKTFVRDILTDNNAYFGFSINASYWLDMNNVTIGGVRANGKGFSFIGLGTSNGIVNTYMANCKVLEGVYGTTTMGFRFGSYAEGFYCNALTAESSGLNYSFVFDNSLGAANFTPKNMWLTNCIGDNARDWNWYLTYGQSIHLTSCWGTSALNSGGIYLGSNVVDVTLEDFTAIGNGTDGIQLDNCATVKIIGCTIQGNSAKASNTDAGVNVKANTNDFIISNCRFNRYGGTASHYADIYIASGTSNNYIIHDNNCDGYVTISISDGGTGNKAKVHDNINYNPASSVFTPSVGASPYTYTAGHTPETVYITGGTVSNITYGGTSLFTATGVNVPLGPNEAIVITYASAPTLRVVHH